MPNSAEQSPINLPYETDLNLRLQLSSIWIQYEQNHNWEISILNDGNIHPRIGKSQYIFYLSEIYFHLNSEYKLQSKQYPMDSSL